MEVEALLTLPEFTIMSMEQVENQIEIYARSSASEGWCPDCQMPSSQIHSWYERHPRELPLQGKPMCLHLEVQRFFCKNEHCKRRTFVKSLPALVVKHAQRTVSLTKQLRDIAFQSGGKGGARLAHQLGMLTSWKTLLRVVKQTALPEATTPRILGIDDWAFRKGRSYGTILVDLEQHEVIELLPDREAETVVTWLKARPEILVITRDRGTNYIEAATKGAPQALQVADRWHLLKNLREAVQTLLAQDRKLLKIKTEVAIVVPKVVPTAVLRAAAGRTLSKADQASLAKRAQRLARYYQAVDMFRKGISIQEIALHLDLSPETVSKYVHTELIPEIKPHLRVHKALGPYQHYLNQRWAAGCRNVRQLWREITQQGYRHNYATVQRYLAHLKDWEQTPQEFRHETMEVQYRRYTPLQMTWLFLKDETDLKAEEQQDLKTLRQQSPELAQVYELTQAFLTMVRDQAPLKFDPWIKAVLASTFASLKSFASGLLRDRQAVVAALAFPWSNGQTEGQVNRLKNIKRQMYGRAGFSLLRKRVLYTAMG